MLSTSSQLQVFGAARLQSLPLASAQDFILSRETKTRCKEEKHLKGFRLWGLGLGFSKFSF